MIYLKEGSIPLSSAYDDEIVQEANSTYQLSFKFPLSDEKWKQLKEETILTADDLHGEQYFVIFEAERLNGIIKVYANQIATLLNYYSVREVHVSRGGAMRAMSELSAGLMRESPFTFYSDVSSSHTLNVKNCSAMDVLTKGKHSILGEWGGDLVRDKYSIRLLENGGEESEALFMYKKNLKAYKETKSTKSLRTRIHLYKTTKGEEGTPDTTLSVTVDSPLLGSYREIYEGSIEVSEDDIKTTSDLIAYGQRYYKSTLCDLLEDSIEIEVTDSDVAVQIFDTVTIHHEVYGIDLRKKVTHYTYSPMTKRLKKIGFGKFSNSLGQAISSIVSTEVENLGVPTNEKIEEIAKKLENADKAFDKHFQAKKQEIIDDITKSKALSEAFNRKISDEIDEKLQSTHEETDKLIEDFFDTDPKIRKLKESVNKNYDELQALLELVGEKTGQVKYNKNRLNGSTEHLLHLTDEDLTISHNGYGFEVGREYTISWSATCIPKAQKVVKFKLHSTATLDDDTVLGILKATVKSLATHPRQPKINFELTHAAQSESVYQDTYTVEVTGDFYERSTQSVEVTDADSQEVLLNITFKKVADGNEEEKFFGIWSENDYIIFDGRDGQ